MNTFILFYAFIILFLVQFFAWPSVSIKYFRNKPVNVELEKIDAVPDYLSEFGDGSVFSRLKYTGKFVGLLEARNAFTDPADITVYYDTTLNPNEVDVEKLIIIASTPMSVSIDGEFQEITGERRLKIARDLATKTGLNRWAREEPQIKEEDLPQVEEIEVRINRRISSLRDFDVAYSEAYKQSDALEDGFPMALFADLGVIYLDRFMADTISSSYENAPTAICVLENGFWFRFGIDEQNVQLLEDCDNFITLEYRWKYFLTRDLSIAGRDLENKVVPYNTLLITSLLPTATFYFVIVLFAVSTRLFSSLVIGTAQIKKYVLRAPLAVASFFLSIPVTIFSIWT